MGLHQKRPNRVARSPKSMVSIGLLDEQRAVIKRSDLTRQDYETACFAIDRAWLNESVMRCPQNSNPARFGEWQRAQYSIAFLSAGSV